ncbi:MAG: glycosyltransferase family 2 protein [Candidatus Levybacteria bacterium]|nr:glycosyltransferase family 2 protein [Candidatus Levybacteria bacterium]
MKLSIVIPVFNEEKTISKILEKVTKLKIPNAEKEIVVVDDGSTDKTAAKLSGFNISGLKIIHHKKNLGKGTAVRTGIENSSGDYIVIQDADLEYDPNDIKKLFIPIQKKMAKVVYGTRLNRLPNLTKDEKSPLFLLHYFGNRFLSLITSVLYGQWITDMETCYKLFPKKALENIKLNSRRFDFEPEITAKLLKKDYKILEIPIETKPRGYGEGKKLNTVRDGTIALWTLLKYRFTQ